MASDFDQMMGSTEQRFADHLGYSIRMICAIAEQYNATLDQADYLKAAAMVDAFYVHLRLLAEFLTKPTNSKDFGPTDFGVEWRVPQSDEADRLSQYWSVASQYVVHFGRPRVPENLQDLKPFQVDNEFFRTASADALRVFAVFLKQLQAQTPSWDGGARIPNRHSEPDEWRARTLFDRTEALRLVFEAACLQVGLDAQVTLEGVSSDK